MSDKKEIDMSTLEQGDTVVLANGQKAFVNLARDNGYNGIIVYLFFESDNDNKTFMDNDDYLVDGKTQFHLDSSFDIMQIIKNPRQWTDEDMKTAFDESVEQMHKKGFTDFDEWFGKYKESKK